MKTTIILPALILAATCAQADTLAEVKNDAGGKIVLLTDKCENGDQRAYMWTKDNHTDEGCWHYDNNTVLIVWQDNGKRRYPTTIFRNWGRVQ